MNNTESQAVSSQPSLLQPIRAGFNVAANHIGLILFPILLDLWIWLGIHVSMETSMSRLLRDIERFMTGSTEQVGQILDAVQELLIERFNLMFALRSYPVGVPSLMSSRLPIEAPFGAPRSIDILSFWNGLVWLIGLTVVGLAIGTFYYLVLSQAALTGRPDWGKAIRKWPWTFYQVLTLTLVWLGMAVAISVPFSCVFPVISSTGLSSFFGFFYVVVMLWLFFPLLLSAHGIFVNREKMINSIMKSVHLTRLTLPATSLFLLFAFLIMQGLDIVWGWPKEDSWFVLVGLAGHAFVANAILAASFLYYREADHWVQRFLRQVLLQQRS